MSEGVATPTPAEGSSTTRRAGVVAGIAALILLASVAYLLRGNSRAERLELHPDLARYHPLQPGEPSLFHQYWAEGSGLRLDFTRRVVGWERVLGEPHAKIELDHEGEVYATEWLRPATTADGRAQLVCSRRRVGAHQSDLAPPQPVLQLPLTPGHSWTWVGRVGGQPCVARFRVVELAKDPTYGEVLRIQQITQLGDTPALRVAAANGGMAGTWLAWQGRTSFESRKTSNFAQGRGLVWERGDLPVQVASKVRDGMVAERQGE